MRKIPLRQRVISNFFNENYQPKINKRDLISNLTKRKACDKDRVTSIQCDSTSISISTYSGRIYIEKQGKEWQKYFWISHSLLSSKIRISREGKFKTLLCFLNFPTHSCARFPRSGNLTSPAMQEIGNRNNNNNQYLKKWEIIFNFT